MAAHQCFVRTKQFRDQGGRDSGHQGQFRSCPRTTHDELSCARKPDIVRDKRRQNVTHVFKQLPTGRGRQTGKNAFSATRCFPVTYIAGLTWGVSHGFETLGPVRDFSGDFTRRVVPRFGDEVFGEVTQIPKYAYQTSKARQVVLTGLV